MFIAALAVLALGSVVFSAAHLYSRLHALRAAESGMLYFFLIVVLGFSFQGSIAGVAFAQSASPPAVGASAPPTNPSQGTYPKHVQELVDYLECLRKAKCSFSLTGEETAQQLGYSRLFASAYEEMILRIKARHRERGRVTPQDMVAEFETIVREEKAIDQLLERRENHAVAISYLRALQNGDTVFPGPAQVVPPQLLLLHIMSRRPEAVLDVFDDTLVKIYEGARGYVRTRFDQANEVSIHEVIGKMRGLILESVSGAQTNSRSVCSEAATMGHMAATIRACPNVVASDPIRRQLTEVTKVSEGMDCFAKSWFGTESEFKKMVTSDRQALCNMLEQFIQVGKFKEILSIDLKATRIPNKQHQ